MPTSNQTETQTLHMERLFDCTPDELYQAWCDPAQFAQWINPFPGIDNTEIHEFDPRPGGRLRFTMVWPDGKRQLEDGRFGAMDPPHMLEWLQPNDDRDDQFAGYPTKTTVRFERDGDQTRLRFELVGLPPSFPLDAAKGGFGTVFEKLADVIRRRQDGTFRAIDQPHEIHFERTFACTPEELWQAWIDPDALAQWFGPLEGLVVEEMDVREGGRFRWAMREEDGTLHPIWGTYHTLRAPHELVFTAEAAEVRPNVTTVRVRFERTGDKTRMTFHQSGLPPSTIQATGEGWTTSWDKLDALVGHQTPEVA